MHSLVCFIGSYVVARGTVVSPSADSRRTVVSYWQKYVHLVLVNHLGDLSLSRIMWLG